MSGLDEDGLPPGHRLHPEWEVAPRAVKERLDAGEVVLVDCRTEEERELARIEPSIFAPMHELEWRIDELRDHEDAAIVVYCHAGVRSLRVTALLRDAGFEDVHSLAGGIDLWSVAVDASVPRY